LNPPATVVARLLAVSPLVRARLVVVGQVDVVDVEVDLGDLESGHALDRRDDVAPDGLGQVGDRDAVVGDQVQVDGGLALPGMYSRMAPNALDMLPPSE
jgi:hypothetical protein